MRCAHQRNRDQYRPTLSRTFSKRCSGSANSYNVLPIKKLDEINPSPPCGSMGEITQSHKGITWRSGANHRGPLSRLAPRSRNVRPTFERNSRMLTDHRRGIVFPGLPIVGETRMLKCDYPYCPPSRARRDWPTCLAPHLFDANFQSPTPLHVILVGWALVSQACTQRCSALRAPRSTHSGCGHSVFSKAHRSP